MKKNISAANKFVLFTAFLVLLSIFYGCNAHNFSGGATESSTLSPNFTPTTNSTLSSNEQDLLGDYLQIAEVQGAGHVSPYKGQEVRNVAGIVTTVSGQGFYIQSAAPDDNDATSEGLFVYNPGLQKVKPGDLVLVHGKVIEQYPGGGQGELSITEIVYAEYEVISSAHPIPDPVLIGMEGRMPPTETIDDDYLSTFDPINDGVDFYESLESMLVEIANPISIAPINKYKELAVVPDNGSTATGLSSRGVLTVQADDFNPERLLIDDSLRALPGDLPIGSTVDGRLIGIVDYTFGMFKIQPITKPTFIYGTMLPDSAPESIDEDLTIASYNVENLDAMDPSSRFTLFATQVVEQLDSPDLIILSEIQDNDGADNTDVVGADITASRMITAIVQAGGPQYSYIDISPLDDRDGGEPGGNIRSAFLYRTDSGLSLVEKPGADAKTAAEVAWHQEMPTLNFSPVRIDPTNYAFANSRKPLVAEFTYKEKTLFVIGMHMNSKGEDTPLFGQKQPPVLYTESQRNLQANAINLFVKELIAKDPDAYVLLGGDLNDFQFATPIQLLIGNELVNPVFQLPENEQYSYIYEGNAQALDHILVSTSLNDKISCFDIVHINSEQTIQDRLSDHDAPYLCLHFE